MLTERRYSIKEFSVNPSKVIHRAINKEENVVLTNNGVPVARVVPFESTQTVEDYLEYLGAMPGVRVGKARPCRIPKGVKMRGEGPSGSEMVLEDRR